MRILSKIILESIRQALQQLRANKLRTFLSLLGISIGIFCIIGVLSAVDSLEDNLRGSMAKLGNDVIYVQKWPWADIGDSWWDYFRRPYPTYEEYERLSESIHSAELSAFMVGIGSRTLKWKSNSVEGVYTEAASIELDRIFRLGFSRGRFFSPAEYHYGSPKIVLGSTTAQELFGGVDPLGKHVKMQGRNFEVIGVIEPSGDDLINPIDFDDAAIVSFTSGAQLVNLRSGETFDGTIALKAREGITVEQLKDEVRGKMRALRRLRPRADENFSLNELSLVSQAFDSFFGALNVLGLIIGGFSILVGGVSVANIMFVSVKERTNFIGVKKALGAKRYIILLEFLIEAIILCIIGGLVGLLLVAGITALLSLALPFAIYLNMTNIIWGITVSIFIGVVAGFIPALQASRLDPVVAMRQ